MYSTCTYMYTYMYIHIHLYIYCYTCTYMHTYINMQIMQNIYIHIIHTRRHVIYTILICTGVNLGSDSDGVAVALTKRSRTQVYSGKSSSLKCD